MLTMACLRLCGPTLKLQAVGWPIAGTSLGAEEGTTMSVTMDRREYYLQLTTRVDFGVLDSLKYFQKVSSFAFTVPVVLYQYTTIRVSIGSNDNFL